MVDEMAARYESFRAIDSDDDDSGETRGGLPRLREDTREPIRCYEAKEVNDRRKGVDSPELIGNCGVTKTTRVAPCSSFSGTSFSGASNFLETRVKFDGKDKVEEVEEDFVIRGRQNFSTELSHLATSSSGQTKLGPSDQIAAFAEPLAKQADIMNSSYLPSSSQLQHNGSVNFVNSAYRQTTSAGQNAQPTSSSRNNRVPLQHQPQQRANENTFHQNGQHSTPSKTQQLHQQNHTIHQNQSQETTSSAKTFRQGPSSDNLNLNINSENSRSEFIEGSKHVTTLATVAAQSGQSRIVLVLLKDGENYQLKIQEMTPAMLQVGTNFRECQRFFREQERLVENLRKQTKTPIEKWMEKYIEVEREETSKRIMSPKRKLVYMCMGENVQACWKALLNQLDKRSELLLKVSQFYEQVEAIRKAIEQSETHLQQSRQLFLEGQRLSLQFNKAINDLRKLNQNALDEYKLAKQKQQELIDEIALIAKGNLNDMREDHLKDEAQNLIRFFENYLKPLELRQLQLESVIPSCEDTEIKLRDPSRKTITTKRITKTTRNTNYHEANERTSTSGPVISNKKPNLASSDRFDGVNLDSAFNNGASSKVPYIRDITNFSDLNLVESWLQVKIDQLNSTLISSLGLNVDDSRCVLSKHEQIALECRTIEEATLKFNGKSIHAIRASSQLEHEDPSMSPKQLKLFERQKSLSSKVTDVIAILETRIVLLRRAIDFYQRSREATGEIAKLMRRLQVDNSLQSIHFVSNELELGDVSSVVASGATILSELQQLQLAQQHGQRPNIIHLNLATSGIRQVIEEVNKDLARLKAVLNQRKLVLMNEDTGKMSSSFANKCQQLHIWLRNEVKCFLIANERIGTSLKEAREYCDSHQQLRSALQNKLSEVEALLRSLPVLSGNLDTNKGSGSEIQQAADELRLDWIQATNCLDRRLQLAKRYVAILSFLDQLKRELECLDKFNDDTSVVSDARTEQDIRASVDQLLEQLAVQVKEFNDEAESKSTALSLDPLEQQAQTRQLGKKSGNQVSDLNKQILIDHVNGVLTRFTINRRDVLRRLENRKSSASQSPASSLQQKTPTPTHLRPQQVLPPRFTRILSDKSVEPFSTVELECETDNSSSRVVWFMNGFKPIPATIRHSIVSENNQHKLIISQFSPICCGTYIAQASNKAGSAVTQCRLHLKGIKEAKGGSQDDLEQAQVSDNRRVQSIKLVPNRDQSNSGSMNRPSNSYSTITNSQTTTITANRVTTSLQGAQPSSPAISTTSSFSQWRPEVEGNNKQQTVSNRQIERIIQGVDSREQTKSPSLSSHRNEPTRAMQFSSDSLDTDASTSRVVGESQMQNNRSSSKQTTRLQTVNNYTNRDSSLSISYYGPQSNQSRLQVISPMSTSVINTSRSVSGSPFDENPEAPSFVQPLTDTLPHNANRAGLVCLVVGNPPPKVEWLHNNNLIATTKCSRAQQVNADGISQKANVCSLTIETVDDQTQGQYVCRARNHLGETVTKFNLIK